VAQLIDRGRREEPHPLQHRGQYLPDQVGPAGLTQHTGKQPRRYLHHLTLLLRPVRGHQHQVIGVTAAQAQRPRTRQPRGRPRRPLDQFGERHFLDHASDNLKDVHGLWGRPLAVG